MGEGEESVRGGNGRKVQVRKARRDEFGEEKKQVFLDHLAGCANIKRAAEAAGVSTPTVQNHRRRDPAFARAMEEALEAAYLTLEALTIERAATGGGYSPGDTPVPGPETLDPETALHLLRIRRAPLGSRTGKGGHRPKRAGEKELKEAILVQLDRLGARLRRSEPGAGTAKGGVAGSGTGTEEGR